MTVWPTVQAAQRRKNPPRDRTRIVASPPRRLLPSSDDIFRWAQAGVPAFSGRDGHEDQGQAPKDFARKALSQEFNDKAYLHTRRKTSFQPEWDFSGFCGVGSVRPGRGPQRQSRR